MFCSDFRTRSSRTRRLGRTVCVFLFVYYLFDVRVRGIASLFVFVFDTLCHTCSCSCSDLSSGSRSWLCSEVADWRSSWLASCSCSCSGISMERVRIRVRVRKLILLQVRVRFGLVRVLFVSLLGVRTCSCSENGVREQPCS